MRIAQVCAYANWSTEAFEVWKWCRSDRPSKEIAREMGSLFLVVFSRVNGVRGLEELKYASRTVGKTDVEVEVTTEATSKILQEARFTHYLGRCLDKERLQYFAPSKVLSKGTVVIQGDNVIIQYEEPKSHKLSDEDKKVLIIRKILGDDPLRVSSDILRASLGQDWNYLFDWKEQFHIRLKRSSKTNGAGTR
jgi:hypothetical protein